MKVRIKITPEEDPYRTVSLLRSFGADIDLNWELTGELPEGIIEEASRIPGVVTILDSRGYND